MFSKRLGNICQYRHLHGRCRSDLYGCAIYLFQTEHPTYESRVRCLGRHADRSYETAAEIGLRTISDKSSTIKGNIDQDESAGRCAADRRKATATLPDSILLSSITNDPQPIIDCGSSLQCPGRDSNSHGPNRPPPPQSGVSTNFTTWAHLFERANIPIIFILQNFYIKIINITCASTTLMNIDSG